MSDHILPTMLDKNMAKIYTNRAEKPMVVVA